MEVGISVIDIDRMLDFYTSVLSCAEERRADIPASLTQALTSGQEGYLAVWLRTPGGEAIKLFRPPQAPEPLAAPEQLTARTGIGFVTFYCTDLTATLAAAEAKGAMLRSERKLIAEEAALRLCFFADPEGNIIELVEVAA